MADCERPFFASTALGRRPVRCGKCIPCQAARRDEWAFRMCMESKGHLSSIFVTLTYSPENLPSDLSVSKKSFQDFMKRYRKAISPRQVRFYACGEYGTDSGRPHYHAIIFGAPESDLGPLNKAWGLGFVSVFPFSLASARYVAKYVIKADQKVIKGREKPFALMSRKPGLGRNFVDSSIAQLAHREEQFLQTNGSLVYDGQFFPIPRYIKDKFAEEGFPITLEQNPDEVRVVPQRTDDEKAAAAERVRARIRQSRLKESI